MDTWSKPLYSTPGSALKTEPPCWVFLSFRGFTALPKQTAQWIQGGLGTGGSLTLNSLAPRQPLHVRSHISYSQWGGEGDTDQG